MKYIKKYPKKASIRLDIGPAASTLIIYCLGLFKLNVLTGTGFAYPNPINNNISDPIGSKCFKGFKVSLPYLYAVSSP